MKRLVLAFAMVFVFSISAEASTFSDNFNDGNTNGWWLSGSHDPPFIAGNWRVEDGRLVRDNNGDAFMALAEGYLVSDLSIETQLKMNDPQSYNGVTVWYKDFSNWVSIFIYPDEEDIRVIEAIDGVFNDYRDYDYEYLNETWYKLNVDADSINGELTVYVDDTFLFTHNTSTQNRTGLAGLYSGNWGGYFDNFSLTSDDITPIPIPSAIWLLGSGLIGLVSLRRKP